jgi:hypothetical protein
MTGTSVRREGEPLVLGDGVPCRWGRARGPRLGQRPAEQGTTDREQRNLGEQPAASDEGPYVHPAERQAPEPGRQGGRRPTRNAAVGALAVVRMRAACRPDRILGRCPGHR